MVTLSSTLKLPHKTTPDDDHFHDECGVFGTYDVHEAANLTYLGLHALQHRGQESAGIASTDGNQLVLHRAVGLVGEIFNHSVLEQLPGRSAIGHVRYSTAGDSHIRNAQPLAVDYAHGSLAIAHNGNLTNSQELRARLETEGSIFQSNSDTEVIVHLIARSGERAIRDRLIEALRRVEGAYSLLLLTQDCLIAARDPYGFRPLCLGKYKDSYVFASEPPAFELIDAEFIRDVEPGEVITIDHNGLSSCKPLRPREKRMCIFEYIYFARPDSTLEGINVYEARKLLGRRLAKEHPVEADVVIPVPDSGVAAALGFAEASNLPFEYGLLRSHYVGRTFIEPQDSIRHFGVRLKLSPVRSVLRGKRVIVVDDSIVRGTTSRKIVKMVRDAGADAVHLRISSPPTRWPCFYGINTPSRSELIASNHTCDEIARHVTADTLGYLSLDGLHDVFRDHGLHPRLEASRTEGHGFCDACFSGDYPITFAPEVRPSKRQLSLLAV